MNWGKIKTILIILFLFTDIFLAFSIFTAQKKETEIPPEVIDATIKILSDRNISVDDSVISVKIPPAAVLQADNVISDFAEFAHSLLGDSFFEESDGVFRTSDKSLKLSGNNFDLEYLTPQNISDSGTLSEAEEFVFSYLKEHGFNVSDAKVVSAKPEGEAYRLKICDYAENMPIYSSNIDISASKDTIMSVSGSWFNKRDSITQNSSLKNITGILVDFATSYDASVPAKIESIELGYSVFDDATYHKAASLIPVSKIKLDNGAEYFIDSRSAE